jgi:hypothetical protein
MTTHTEDRDAFTCVLINVFEIRVVYPLALALEKSRYHDIHDIFGMSLADIKALSSEDDQENEIDLPVLRRLPLPFLKGWSNFNDWKSITAQELH